MMNNQQLPAFPPTDGNNGELPFLSALTQAELIRSRQISPIELTELYLDRIAKYDRDLGSFVTIMGDRAIAVARQQTEMLASTSPQELPPFFGVPTAIKDLNAVAGVPSSYGTIVMKDYIPDYDDGIVTLMQGAGFNILGKTSISELASFPYGEATGFPPSRNPWNLDYTPGGSSGGAAAAVAAGLIPIAQGSDGGGSLRGPAHCCGLVAIKPTRGRVTDAPVGDRISGLAAIGPVARNVADAAALLDVLSHPFPGDPYRLAQPETSFFAASQIAPQPLKIALCDEFLPFGRVHPLYRESIERVGKLLAREGHSLEVTPLDVSGLIEPFSTVWSAGVGMAGLPAEVLNPVNQYILTRSGAASEYLKALGQLQVWARQFTIALDRFDVILAPVYMHPTIKVGEWDNLSPAETFEKIKNWIVPCPIFNATGQPVVTIPVAKEPDTGLPIGVQLVGKLGMETTIISLAAQLEKIVGN
jgi:amidase